MAAHPEVVITIIEAVTALFSLTASLAALAFLLYYKSYRKLLHRLFILILVSSVLASLAIFFESISVDVVLIQAGGGSVKAGALCTVSGAIIHYSNWVDVLVITATAIWLTRITLKTRKFETKLDKQQYKEKIRQKYWEGLGYVAVFLFPILPTIPPLATGNYEANQGPWCRIQLLENSTNREEVDLDEEALAIALVVWYVPVFVILMIDTIILTISNVKLYKKLRRSLTVLKGSHASVLKDGISLSIFLMVIYAVYCINIFTAFYFILSNSPDTPLWIVEAAATAIRGVAILCMFFNPRMRKTVRNQPNSHIERLVGNIFDQALASDETLLTTPADISISEIPSDSTWISHRTDTGVATNGGKYLNLGNSQEL